MDKPSLSFSRHNKSIFAQSQARIAYTNKDKPRSPNANNLDNNYFALVVVFQRMKFMEFNAHLDASFLLALVMNNQAWTFLRIIGMWQNCGAILSKNELASNIVAFNPYNMLHAFEPLCRKTTDNIIEHFFFFFAGDVVFMT